MKAVFGYSKFSSVTGLLLDLKLPSFNTMVHNACLTFRSYYRAMHFSAKRGIAIACRLSVCLSVCL